MHIRRRGKSHSTRPPSKKVPIWLDLTPETVEQIVHKLAKEGKTPSEIGLILRDEHGVPLFEQVTGKKLTRFLEEKGEAPEMPEDITRLLDRAKGLIAHLKQNKKDRKNKHALESVEAKIYRLSKYYKRIGKLPKDWRYRSVVAKLE